MKDFSNEFQQALHDLALFCCETGEAPIFLGSYLKNSGIKEKYDYLTSEVRKTGITCDESTHPSYSPEEFYVLKLMEKEVRHLQLIFLMDEGKNIETIQKKAPGLENIIIRSGDDAGLVPVNLLKNGRQWFEYEGKAIYIAPAIPGALNASYPLAGFLCHKNKYPDLKIRPDAFRIIDVSHATSRMELSKTFGKPFNVEWLKKLKGVALAQHDPDPNNYLIRGHTTQFIWERLDGDEVQFSCEELPHYQDHSSIKKLNSTRFVHGIYNIKLNSFTHFDGAVHIYDEISYSNRLGVNLSAHYMNYSKCKIFRTDSVVNIKDAEFLLSLFYRWNDLPVEYFTV